MTAELPFFRRLQSEFWIFSGSDALRFLSGVSTPHVSRTVSGGLLCGRGLFLDHKGKLLCPFLFFKNQDTIYVRPDLSLESCLENTFSESAGSTSKIKAHLNHVYENLLGLIIADDVRVTRQDCTVVQVWSLNSNDSGLVPYARDLEFDEVFVPRLDAHENLFIPRPHMGTMNGFQCQEVWNLKTHHITDFDGVPVNMTPMEESFFECGFLEMFKGIEPGDLPIEFGFLDAISFFKGCYRGQETIARAMYRGKLVKSLALLTFQDSLSIQDKFVIDASGAKSGEIRNVLKSQKNKALVVLRFSAEGDLVSDETKNRVIHVRRFVSETHEKFRT